MAQSRLGFRRVVDDIRHRRNLEAYSLFAAAVIITVLTLVGDIPTEITLSAILGAVAFLVFKATDLQRPSGGIEQILKNRDAYEHFPEFIEGVRRLYIYTPVGINIFPGHAGDLKTGILEAGGRVRVVLIDPVADPAHLESLSKQVSRSITDIHSRLAASISALKEMRTWGLDFEYRLLAFNPGFSIMILDPEARNARVLVEFHGFDDESLAQRMHVTIHRSDSASWYGYWRERFDCIWEAARTPTSAAGPQGA